MQIKKSERQTEKTISRIISILKEETKKFENPLATIPNDPFSVLISCLLSLRTKDPVTAVAAKRLFSKAKTPQEISKLPTKKIEQLIYPVGFYKTKAHRLKEICKTLVKNYNKKVPDNMDELLKFKGVGRKTANIVLLHGFHKPAIPVDTHVHRISNRFGIVKAKTPEQTEKLLMKVLPKKYWADYNSLLVTFGQNICKPVSPCCSICQIKSYCNRIGVGKSR